MRTRINDVGVVLPALLLAGAISVAVAGCGGHSSAPAHAATAEAGPAVPAGWGRLRLRSGAQLPYPGGWRTVRGDPGSASAALFNADGTIRAYLNATPADGHETLAGWARFRLRHNAAEGDRNVRLITARTGVVVGPQRRSCVVDDYVTSRSRYRELACMVAPANGGQATVLVAAAQPSAWGRERPMFDFAVNHFSS